MNFVMAGSTKSDSITDLYSKRRSIFPGLDMMDYSQVFTRNVFIAFLAGFIVTHQAIITPFYILPIIKLSLWIELRLSSFGSTYFWPTNFAKASTRTIQTFAKLIWITPVRFSANQTSLELTFFHDNIILGNKCENK